MSELGRERREWGRMGGDARRLRGGNRSEGLGFVALCYSVAYPDQRKHLFLLRL